MGHKTKCLVYLPLIVQPCVSLLLLPSKMKIKQIISSYFCNNGV